MAELKAHEFDAALSRIASQFRFFLIYGPDRGLVSERAAALAKKSGVKLDDPFSLVRIDSADLGTDSGRLIDEARSIGLFGGEKLVWVRASGGEKALHDASAGLLAQKLEGCMIIVEAGDLKKGTGLRKLVEGASQGLAIPCYADDDRSINLLIDQELAAEGLKISAPARMRLLEVLGGDRLASRNEIRKLALYTRGDAIVEEQHVIDIVGDASAISVDDAVDCILSGDAEGFVHAVQKVISSRTAVFLVIQACLRQLQLIDLMRSDMDDKGASLQQVMAAHGRGLHFRRKPIIEAALRHWSALALAAELNRLQTAILLSRQNNSMENSIIIQTLLATTLQSRRK